MTTPKIDSQFTEAVGDVLSMHAERLYERLGETVVAVVELKSVERLQPAADENKAPVVKLKLTTCEIATGAHADQIRRVQEALYRVRTSAGTLDEAGVVDAQAAQQTIEHAADVALETPFQPADDDSRGEE